MAVLSWPASPERTNRLFMGTINETVKTANSAIRTLLLSILVAGAGLAGWQGYSLYNEPQKKLAIASLACACSISNRSPMQTHPV
jgi:hypothetical protein